MVYSFLITLALATLLALFSLAMLTYGYSLLRTLLPFFALFYGMMITTYGISLIFGHGFVTGVVTFLPALIVGIIFALLASSLYDVFVILIGASFGWILVSYLFSLIGIDNSFWVGFASFIASVIVAIYILTKRASDFVEFFVSSALGSTTLITSVFLITAKVGLDAVSFQLVWGTITSSVFWLILWIAAFMFGVVSQFYSRIYNG